MLEKFISKLFVWYVEFIVSTSKLLLDDNLDEEMIRNSIVSSWHSDSFAMNFLLKIFSSNKNPIYVVTTSNRRGNVIEKMVEKYSGRAVRMPDGIKMKNYLTALKETSKIKNSSLYITLDGPIGPYREPKKLPFLLSNESEKNLVLINIEYSNRIVVTKRWDKYVVPLPFGKIKFKANKIGIISKEDLKNFKEFKNIALSA
ncbi:MAG: hypothetical protein ACRC57_00845 [Sarcina sp.]